MLLRNTTMYCITGTKFFRLASRKIQGYGGNTQNIPKDMRSIYVPDGWKPELRYKYAHYLEKGDLEIFTPNERQITKVMVQYDQAGAEALIVSKLLKSGNKLDLLFKNKIKPHTYLGCFFPQVWIDAGYPQVDTIRMLPIEKVKTHEGWKSLSSAINESDLNQTPKVRYYYLYKQTCHSGNYGIKTPTFILNVLEKSEGRVVLTKQQGDEFLNAYHYMLPELRDWWEYCENQVRTTGIIYNLQGYPIHFTQELKDGDLKDVYSACPQSTVGTITNIAYTNLQNFIEDEKKDWDLLANTHDSYLCQCPVGEEKVLGERMKYFLEQELTSPTEEKFNMRSEGQYGFNWGSRKVGVELTEDIEKIEKYNLCGLRELTV